MPASLHQREVADAIAAASQTSTIQITVPGLVDPKNITKPFPSPVDWRDKWIYFLMIDRFNNPSAGPNSQWDREAGGRQGGTFEGLREKLAYLEDLGVGAIWLTPVLKNRQAHQRAATMVMESWIFWKLILDLLSVPKMQSPSLFD